MIALRLKGGTFLNEQPEEMPKKVHLVFDADVIDNIADALKEFARVVGKDFTLDTAAQWAKSGQGESPDIVLIDGTVDVSRVDLTSGRLARDNAFIGRLKEIRVSRPASQIILLLPEERANDTNFLQAIVSLAIFDIYLVKEFNEQQLRLWLETRKTIADIQHIHPGAELIDNEISEKKSSYGRSTEKSPSKQGFLGKFIKISSKERRLIEPKSQPCNTQASNIPEIQNTIKELTAISAGGLFIIVTPWRPGLAGKIAAIVSTIISEDGNNVVVIGGTGQSTVAAWLEISEEELMLSDWRVPGSQTPVIKSNLNIWAVDPYKGLNLRQNDETWQLLKEVRSSAKYIILDLAGDLNMAQKAALQKDAVVLVIIPGDDLVEYKTAIYWLNQLKGGRKNVISGLDLRGISTVHANGFEPDFFIQGRLESTIRTVIRKSLDQYIISV
jgi:hypothetical protein